MYICVYVGATILNIHAYIHTYTACVHTCTAQGGRISSGVYYAHSCMHTYMHICQVVDSHDTYTCIHTCFKKPTCIHKPTNIRTYIQTYVRTYIHNASRNPYAFINPHTYIHTYTHTYIHTCSEANLARAPILYTPFVIFFYHMLHSTEHMHSQTHIHTYIHTYIRAARRTLPEHLFCTFLTSCSFAT
jgi:hypothetical protein